MPFEFLTSTIYQVFRNFKIVWLSVMTGGGKNSALENYTVIILTQLIAQTAVQDDSHVVYISSLH